MKRNQRYHMILRTSPWIASNILLIIFSQMVLPSYIISMVFNSDGISRFETYRQERLC